MRSILFLLITFSLGSASAQEASENYSVKPNTTGYPFPATFPILAEGKARFDWKQYISESVSGGDKIFRAHLALTYGFDSDTREILGVAYSEAEIRQKGSGRYMLLFHRIPGATSPMIA